MISIGRYVVGQSVLLYSIRLIKASFYVIVIPSTHRFHKFIR